MLFDCVFVAMEMYLYICFNKVHINRFSQFYILGEKCEGWREKERERVKVLKRERERESWKNG